MNYLHLDESKLKDGIERAKESLAKMGASAKGSEGESSVPQSAVQRLEAIRDLTWELFEHIEKTGETISSGAYGTIRIPAMELHQAVCNACRQEAIYEGDSP